MLRKKGLILKVALDEYINFKYLEFLILLSIPINLRLVSRHRFQAVDVKAYMTSQPHTFHCCFLGTRGP
jgi:hypothetical protein